MTRGRPERRRQGGVKNESFLEVSFFGCEFGIDRVYVFEEDILRGEKVEYKALRSGLIPNKERLQWQSIGVELDRGTITHLRKFRKPRFLEVVFYEITRIRQHFMRGI
ncbi:MAG: hypothetical protein [Microviridae sp.]|nr:MAG: hypothetical protein [Microviridae sp.]